MPLPTPRWSLPLTAALLALSPVHAQLAPAPSASTATSAQKPVVVVKTADETDPAVTLTPFEVNSANDRGYQATATMSGTRLNSNLEDLGASLSVVTKQQLLDTASTDINDVFKSQPSHRNG